ncbi:alpha-D-glucose phosphate-specific phosphoglucomutase [Pseudolysobacter antarcticus]|uniref:Phosphoglucomutase n=1 Tax=Pseudolysobacter antarcticus TaxID=2511995 RepID=A0A411HLM7_9GAMM|nr:phosphoglucomutase (alpha-D-glucose-1,6-bisphosphate-dependent) [Pseudolysobacter antarcticus]QBB71277.1 alpha-D-glucose phosphate-specific phosphoglucomutase [Pseudolysobacter antarcticus]
MNISPLAGKPAPDSLLVDIDKLLTAYFELQPDPSVATQRVAFGTSGHRGSSFERSFNEWHILAITQAICAYRRQKNIDGPLFIGIDTHALSQPALNTALEVLAANGVETMIAAGHEFTPTPVISHAILTYNRGRQGGFADGIVVTPSHNPPSDGGFKYNTPNGGPADTDVTGWIQDYANQLIEKALDGVRRMPAETARRAATTHEHDFLHAYVSDLDNIIDMDAIRGAKIRMGVDPLGGAGVHYWPRIAEHYRLDLSVVSDVVDATFRFMSVDWDGKIRMDPSSKYAMQRLLDMRGKFDIAFACDTDHDRHGIVSNSAGLLPPNHYLAVMIDYLYSQRTQWNQTAAIGKTIVSSTMIDRVAKKLGRNVYEVPVGFKWFVGGLLDGSLGFGGEESAGASFLRRDGGVWSTDKDGIVSALLSAEILARTGRDPGENYRALENSLGPTFANRVDAAATPAQKQMLGKLSPEHLQITELAGTKVMQVLNRAPGNDIGIGGIKVISEAGWFAARPSGTENIYKIYGESFRSDEHLVQILQEAQKVVDQTIASA